MTVSYIKEQKKQRHVKLINVMSCRQVEVVSGRRLVSMEIFNQAAEW